MKIPDYVREISKRLGVNRQRASLVFDAYLHLVKETVISGHDVLFNNFGVLVASKRKQRLGWHIHAGHEVIVPARVLPKFRPASSCEAMPADLFESKE